MALATMPALTSVKSRKSRRGCDHESRRSCGSARGRAQDQADEEHGNTAHDHGDPILSRNKKVALLIAVIALFLAFSETMGKSAQTNALNHQIEASNLWNFFQAKNIRRT